MVGAMAGQRALFSFGEQIGPPARRGAGHRSPTSVIPPAAAYTHIEG